MDLHAGHPRRRLPARHIAEPRMNPRQSCRTLLACLALAAASPAHAADQPSTAEQTVDALNKLWGAHPGMRANHAKGVVVEGSFSPAPGAAKLSKSPLFKGPLIPITVRFSDSSGLPAVADGDPKANPHGMSIKFALPDGSEADIVTNSLHMFPVATGEDFRDLLLALGSTGPGAPHPTPAEKFIAAHPSVPKAFATVHTPDSLAHETYYGIDAFIFVDAAGKRQPFRYLILPAEGTHYLQPADAAKRQPDFLMADIPARLAKGKITFKLMAQLASPGDQTRDPTQAWPAGRELAEIGTITLARPDPDSSATEKKLLFLPNNLTDGIEVSDDPLIDARDQAYAVSYGRRTQ
jgi:catalase